MTPEALAFAVQLLLDEGALDVYTTSIGMKKSRQGIMLTCMCKTEESEKFAAFMFKHTTTLGIRENISNRYTMERELSTKQTPYGSVTVKTATGYGVTKSKPEYEDLARIAKENSLLLADVIQMVER